MAAKNDDEFVLTRLFEAPRELVWKAWTDPAHLAAWWGPHIFTNTCKMDVREGGRLRISMIAPDGVEFPMTGVFREVTAPRRLVYTADLSEHPKGWHGLPGDPSTTHTTTVDFEAVGNRTRITVRMEFESPVMQAAIKKLGATEGWGQSLEKLDWLLAADRSILTSRVFSAPRPLVWKLWTDPEHIAHWWGPNGFSLREVVEPERIVMSHVSGPIFEMTVTFAEWADKSTRVSVHMRFESAADRERVAREVGAVEGLEQTLNRLGERVASLVG